MQSFILRNEEEKKLKTEYIKIIYLIPFVYFQKVLSNICSECFVYQIFVH